MKCCHTISILLLFSVTTLCAFIIQPRPVLKRIHGTFNSKQYHDHLQHSFRAFPAAFDNDGYGDESIRNDKKKSPKVIIFDLDGCLWKPEMYELVWFSDGKGAPFSPGPDGTLLTCANEPVYLLGDVKTVMKELYCNKKKWGDGEETSVMVGISSRTDEPDWARELLQKFEIGTLSVSESSEEEETFTLQDVFRSGPIEIAKDSKVKHFERISKFCGDMPMEDMLFFDNERGNCREIAKLGVTVAYVPDGVTVEMWEVALEAFPSVNGDVIGLDIYGLKMRRLLAPRGNLVFITNIFQNEGSLMTPSKTVYFKKYEK